MGRKLTMRDSWLGEKVITPPKGYDNRILNTIYNQLAFSENI